jgi:K+-sensing histidine kinase KdpD
MAAKRGESLTRQLLTFSRRQHLSPTVVQIHDSIRNMRTLIESSLRGNIVYDERIAPDVWRIKVDLAELELAIVNIAVNARDAMPNGGAFTLTAQNVNANNEQDESSRTEDVVALEFSDSGLGIPPNLLSKIFDPFFTTKEVGREPDSVCRRSMALPIKLVAGCERKADSEQGRRLLFICRPIPTMKSPRKRFRRRTPPVRNGRQFWLWMIVTK